MNQNKAIVQRLIDEVLNNGNFAVAAECMAEDVIEQVPFPGQGPGLAGVVEVIRGMRAAFAGMHWTIQEQIAEGDAVVTRFEWTGKHTGAFLGVEPTAKSVKVWGMVIDRFANKKIVDTRIIMDLMGLMMQLK